MILIGVFQSIAGLTAILDDDFFVRTPSYTFDMDTTAWGWIHLLLGILLIVVGIFLLRGAGWARILAVVIVGIHMVAQFGFISSYPVWGIIMIALDALILYALLVHGREISAV